MENVMIYFVRASLVLAILWGMYKLFFSKNSFYSLNRMILWSILVLTLVLPFVHFHLLPEHKQVVLSIPMDVTYSQGVSSLQVADVSNPFQWNKFILLLYGIGLTFFLIRYVIGAFQLASIIRHSEQRYLENGVVLCVTDRKVNPFSFWHYIVVPKSEENADDSLIMMHEKSHIRNKHSVDKIIFDLFCIFFWFNPFAWLLKRELQALQEFQADADVLGKGINIQQYQLLLIRKSVSEKNFALANNFLQCDLHKRIKMMKNKTNSRRKWNYLLAIPAMVVCAFVLSVPKLNAKTNLIIVENPSVNVVDENVLINDVASIISQKETKELKQSKEKFKISGFVKSKNLKKPLAGAIIRIKGTNVGTTAGQDGSFSLDVEEGVALEFMYPDYNSYQVVVSKNHPILGINLTSEKEVATTITINDNPKLNPNFKPLYIIDGIEQKDDVLKNLDPKDIESMTVLKGGEAAALYGTRGANGVILITTKNKSKSIEKALVVVDGEVMEDDFDMKTIKTDDIKAVTVIKSADGVKRYGEKAKNGVIEITMKK